MYKSLEKAFLESPSKRKIAEALLRYGLRIGSGGKIYCAEIELPPAKIARALNVDRRVVIETAGMILDNDELFGIFSELMPTAFMSKAASRLGFESIEIKAEPHAIGIVSKISKIISDEKICIRQIVADDPDVYPEPKLTIILEKKLSGNAIDKLRRVKGVKEIVIR
jgi:hypothetical protein